MCISACDRWSSVFSGDDGEGKNAVIMGCDGEGVRRAFFDLDLDGVPGTFAVGLILFLSLPPSSSKSIATSVLDID